MSDLGDELRDGRAAEYGYREVGGREFRTALSAERREARHFKRFVKALRTRQWRIRLRERGGELEGYRRRQGAAERARVARIRAEGGAPLDRLRKRAREWRRAWMRKVREVGGELLARHNERQRRWLDKPEVKARRQTSLQRRRAEAYRRNPLILTCACCGATWCKAPWVRGVQPRYCDDNCYKRAKYREGKASAGEALREHHCRACGEVGHNARRHKGRAGS